MSIIDKLVKKAKKQAQKFMIETFVSSTASTEKNGIEKVINSSIETENSDMNLQLYSFSNDIGTHIKGQFSKQITEEINKERKKVTSIFGTPFN